MAKNVATRPSAPTIAVPLSGSLEAIALEIAGAIQESASLSETLGALTIKAGKEIAKAPDMLAPFADACRQTCEAVGLSDGSVKVYLSNIRGVLRAMLAGYVPKAGQTLRSMYDAAPKGTGRQKTTGPRQATQAAPVSAATPEAAPELSKAERQRAAIVELFGHVDESLIAAIGWSATHELRFVNLVKAQIEFDAKPVKLRKAA